MELVLASGSPYRARVLRDAGYRIEVDPAGVDERALDHLLAERGAEGLALELARLKAAEVLPRHPGVPVLAADQVGILPAPGGPRMLTKAATKQAAVSQLMAMSGTRHQLVNALVLAQRGEGGHTSSVEGVDVQVVTMASFDEATARLYVEAHEPLDTAGSYRLEDDAGLVVSVEGEDDSGVLGMPLPLLERLLARPGPWCSPRPGPV